MTRCFAKVLLPSPFVPDSDIAKKVRSFAQATRAIMVHWPIHGKENGGKAPEALLEYDSPNAQQAALKENQARPGEWGFFATADRRGDSKSSRKGRPARRPVLEECDGPNAPWDYGYDFDVKPGYDDFEACHELGLDTPHGGMPHDGSWTGDFTPHDSWAPWCPDVGQCPDVQCPEDEFRAQPGFRQFGYDMDCAPRDDWQPTLAGLMREPFQPLRRSALGSMNINAGPSPMGMSNAAPSPMGMNNAGPSPMGMNNAGPSPMGMTNAGPSPMGSMGPMGGPSPMGPMGPMGMGPSRFEMEPKVDPRPTPKRSPIIVVDSMGQSQEMWSFTATHGPPGYGSWSSIAAEEKAEVRYEMEQEEARLLLDATRHGGGSPDRRPADPPQPTICILPPDEVLMPMPTPAAMPTRHGFIHFLHMQDETPRRRSHSQPPTQVPFDYDAPLCTPKHMDEPNTPPRLVPAASDEMGETPAPMSGKKRRGGRGRHGKAKPDSQA